MTDHVALAEIRNGQFGELLARGCTCGRTWTVDEHGNPTRCPEEAPLYPDGPPDHGTHPDAELEHPRSPAFLVFTPNPAPHGLPSVGTVRVVAFGPSQRADADALAARMQGLIVAVPVLADHRPTT